MSVPFIRGYPSKACRVTAVERPLEVETIARDFINRGGLYFCEVLGDGKVNLFACVMKNDEPVEVETRLTENGPPLMDAVDEIVRSSIIHLAAA